jgi:hypothetical protein
LTYLTLYYFIYNLYKENVFNNNILINILINIIIKF